MGHTPDKGFKRIIFDGKKGLQKCPVSVHDVTNAAATYGPNCQRNQGATTRHRADTVLEGRIKTP